MDCDSGQGTVFDTVDDIARTSYSIEFSIELNLLDEALFELRVFDEDMPSVEKIQDGDVAAMGDVFHHKRQFHLKALLLSLRVDAQFSVVECFELFEGIPFLHLRRENGAADVFFEHVVPLFGESGRGCDFFDG